MDSARPLLSLDAENDGFEVREIMRNIDEELCGVWVADERGSWSETLSRLIERAMKFAREAHAHQRRKYTDEPYEVHLRAVAGLVRSIGAEPEAQAAAWLHDVVEDTEVTLEQVEEKFGAHVARLVEELTDVSGPQDGNRAARKQVDRERLARACAESQTVKLADLIDNARSITEHDPRFAKVFLAEMRALLEVLGSGDEQLQEFARDTLEACLRELERGKPAAE